MLFSNFERRKRNLKSFSPVSRGEREILNSFPLFWEEKEKTRVHTIIEIINRNLPLDHVAFQEGKKGRLLSWSSLIFSFNLFSPQNSGQTISENQQARKVQYTLNTFFSGGHPLFIGLISLHKVFWFLWEKNIARLHNCLDIIISNSIFGVCLFRCVSIASSFSGESVGWSVPLSDFHPVSLSGLSRRVHRNLSNAYFSLK